MAIARGATNTLLRIPRSPLDTHRRLIIPKFNGNIKSATSKKNGGFFMAKNTKDVQKRADEKRAGQRTRNWTAIFYPEDLPEDWRELVNDQHVKWVESPLHDKDLNADGEPKKPHHHVMFCFDAVKTCEQIMDMLKELFGESDGSIVGVAPPCMVKDRGALIRYFAHMDNPEKAQYDPADIIGHNGIDVAELLRYSATETRLMIIAMEEFIEQRKLTELCAFSAAIRYEHPEWHTLLATKMTMYFSAFIKSRKYTCGKPEKVLLVDADGVIVEPSEEAMT